jgi:hypothetical protein
MIDSMERVVGIGGVFGRDPQVLGVPGLERLAVA